MTRTLAALALLTASAITAANDGGIDTGYGLNQGVSASFTTPEAFVQDYPLMANTTSGRTWLVQAPSFTQKLAIARFVTETGMPDLGFGPNADGRRLVTMPVGLTFYGVTEAVAQTDHRIVVTGYGVDTASPDALVAIVCRLTASGAFDLSFDGDGCRSLRAFQAADEDCSPLALLIDASQRIVVGGYCRTNVNRSFVARLTTTGALDIEFAAGAGFKLVDLPVAAITEHTVTRLALDSVGRLVAGVDIVYNNVDEHVGAIRLDDGGSMDPGFGTNGLTNISAGLPTPLNQYPGGLMLRKDGRIVLTIRHAANMLVDEMMMARLTPDGLMDPTFGNGSGRVITPAPLGSPSAHYNRQHAILDEQERIIVATDLIEDNFQLVIERFLASGHPDPQFGTGGRIVHDLGDAIGEPDPVTNQMGGVAAIGGRLLLGTSAATADNRTAFAVFRTENGGVFKDSFE